MDKSPITLFEKFCFLYMGFTAISCFNAFISNGGIFTSLYGANVYTAINFSLSVPNILIGLFVPRIINKFGGNILAYTNITAQIVVALIHIVIVAAIGNTLSPDNSTRIATLVLIFFTIFLSSTMYAIVQTLFFGIAGFSHLMVQLYITGLSTSGLILSVYILIVNQITDSPVIKNTLRYIFVILIYIVSIPLYRQISKLRVAPKNAAGLEKQTTKIDREVYIRVFRKKWFILLLAGGQFFFTFLVFPTLMFLAQSSNPKFESWPTVLMFIFGVAEVSARVLNTMNLKVLRGLINKRNILYFCLFNYASCLVPLLTFLAMRGYINISPLNCDILNGIFYGLLAFNLGFIGNNLAGMAHEGMEGVDMNVLGSYFNFSIVVSVFLGSGVSTLIANVVTAKA